MITTSGKNITLSIAKGNSFLTLYKKWNWKILLIAATIQLLFFFSLENLFATICALTGWKLTEVFIIRSYIVRRFSLSAFMVIGFAITQYCMPLVFILIEGKPLVYNLDLPYEVFIHSLLAIMVLLLAHGLYRNLQKGTNHLKQTMQWFLKKRGFFSAPSNRQVWLMGFIGLSAMGVISFSGKQYTLAEEDRGLFIKLIQSLIPFAYTPYFILLQKLYNSSQKKESQPTLKILAYTVLLLTVGIAGNSRGLFITGITAAVIAYFLGLLLAKFSFRIFNFKNIFICFLGLWLFTGPLSDLGTAMVVVREQRSSLSSNDLLLKTLTIYQNKEALRLYKLKAIGENTDWDEHYFNNIFLARFCNLKFNDEGLKQYHKIGHIDQKIQEYSIKKFWAIFPRPLLSILKINKDDVMNSSFGDYMLLRTGGTNILGGFRTGQFASTGMATFGWWYLLWLGIGVIPLFFLVDLFVLYKPNYRARKYITLFSLAGLIPITSFFMFFSLSSESESIVNIYTYLIRGWIQLVFLYWLIFQFTRLLTRNKTK